MQSNIKLSGFVRQTLALTALLSASAVLAGAQTAAPKSLNLQLPAVQTAAAEPEFSSSAAPDVAADGTVETAALAPHVDFLNAMQYGGRQRSGRPRYRGGNTTQDGVEKYTFYAGVGLAAPLGNMHKYDTPSYAYQVGFGRNFTRHAALNVQFDWDNFGLQGSTLANQFTLYNNLIVAAGGVPGTDTLDSLNGNAHIWSFTLDPQYNFYSGEGLGAYVIGGVGFYHKVTTFTTPQTGLEEDGFGDIYEVEVDGLVDHYTSNSVGVNGGVGLTYKFSRFANERLYLEARYVYVPNSQRFGLTVNSPINSASINATNDYPANSNRSGYIPVKVGIRF